MNRLAVRHSLLLLLTAAIWGVAFVAQSVGMDYVGPFTFNAVRSVIGGIVLLPVIAFRGRTRKKSAQTGHTKVWTGGIFCGILLCIATNLQQIGIKYTTVGKAGFVTAMYIVLVPVFGIFLHKKVGRQVKIAVVLAVCGLYLLCMTEGGFVLQKGDILMLFCALMFSFQILAVDHFASLVDGVQLACIQFVVCGLLSSIPMLLLERPAPELIAAAWLPIIYAGVLSSGVGYTLQIVAQRGLNPTTASLLMSMESVFSVLAGWLILQQRLSKRELIGCVLMFAAIILVQIKFKFSETCE